MPVRPASHKVTNARYKRFSREMQSVSDAHNPQPVNVNLSEKYGLVWRGPRAVEVQRNGRAVRVFREFHSASANWNAALAWAQSNEEVAA